MEKLIEDYQKALDAIYDHVGLKEDWVVCPIDDKTDMFWGVDGKFVRYAETIEKFNSDGDYYQDDIYTQRHYPKHVYEGAEMTLVFCDPHTDGVQWWRLFDNSKCVLVENGSFRGFWE